MRTLFDAEMPVHYRFIVLSLREDRPDLTNAVVGQRNGLCGAAVPGVLSMITGLHTGSVPFTVEWHDAEPPLDPDWEEVVEVPFSPGHAELSLSSFEHGYDLELPVTGSLRARFCA